MAIALISVIAQTPAFSSKERRDGIFGDWRLGFGSALYDRPAYLFQLAYGYINGDVTISAATETADEIADAETATQRAVLAEGLLRESLAEAPGNAHAWTALAWALSMQSRSAEAREAMANSWSLAPFNAELAEDRLAFADLVTGLLRGIDEPPLTEDETVAVKRDLSTLRMFRPDIYQTTIDGAPALAELAE